jgi:hypothetical protein
LYKKGPPEDRKEKKKVKRIAKDDRKSRVSIVQADPFVTDKGKERYNSL